MDDEINLSLPISRAGYVINRSVRSLQASDEPSLTGPKRQHAYPWDRQRIVVLDCSAFCGNSVEHSLANRPVISELSTQRSQNRVHGGNFRIWRRTVSGYPLKLSQQLLRGV